MTRQLEAVFVEGVLRPLEPLALNENQHVILTVTDMPSPMGAPGRAEEIQWLSAHQGEYRGLWVALQGSQLVSSGPKAVLVREEARQKGFPRPLMVRMPDESGLPSAGWL